MSTDLINSTDHMATITDGHAHRHRLPDLQIKQEDKFFSKLLSKEGSAEASFRFLYYGKSSGAVPFTWESQPGTPKHPSSRSSIPPLTPPPSYLSNSKSQPLMQHHKISRSNFFIHAIFPRRNIIGASKKSHVSPSLSSYSSISSSCSSNSYSNSVPSTPILTTSTGRRRRRRSRWHSMSSVRFGIDDDDQDQDQKGPSAFCLSFRDGVSKKFGGKFKNALMSIVRYGTA